jgi:regulator of protease activity HflC (stomatin/prohibitin superfamily)
MSSVKGWRFLRAATGPMLFTAFASMAAAVCVILAYMLENPIPEKILAWVIAAVTGLTGFELLAGLVGSAFVPRIPGIEILPPYHSRGLDIITSPGEILKTVADAVDYQFGFRVSETWFYAFIQKAIIPLLVFWALTLYAFTCVVIIGADEQAILERFGRPIATLDSGLHFKYPYPIDIAYRYPAKSVQTITIGFDEELENQPAITWTEKHYKKEDLFMVATREPGGEAIPRDDTGAAKYTPVSFMAAAVKLHYRITDLHKYAYEKSNPKDYITDIAYREVVKFMGSIDIFDLLQERRLELAEDLRGKIQNVLRDADIGVDVFYLGFEGAHPPVEVGEAFESVLGAQEQAHATVHRATAYAKETGFKAGAEAHRILQEAGAYAYGRKKTSEAEAAMFLMQKKAYEVAPGVYRNRKLMEAFEKGLKNRRKYVVPPGAKMKSNVIFDLKDKLEFRLEDIELEGDKR